MPPPRRRRGAATAPPPVRTQSYSHDAESPLRPDVGTQAQFRKKKPPRSYRYDSSLSPALQWDENGAREQGEALLKQIMEAGSLEEAREAARRLAGMSRPFLNWAGKAERLSFDVPTLPLFVHERLSTKAILETVRGHETNQQEELDLFGDPRHSITDQVLRAYEHRDRWVNRMVLGDSLVVMNSLLEYEGLGGQVQMIYIDPPYGVKFGSNFQPFVRKRDVKHNDDGDMTREPETVQAYRDTWELGLHSYLTYLRDRLLLARELLTPSGSVFVQISDENLHHVREVMDEVFGAENFVSLITLQKTTGASSPTGETKVLATVSDYIIWYARDREQVKFRRLFSSKGADDESAERYDQVQLPDGARRPLTQAEKQGQTSLPEGARRYQCDNLTSMGTGPDADKPFTFDGKNYLPGRNSHWKTSLAGMATLARKGRIQVAGNSLRYVRFLDDFAARPIANVWTDISGSIQSRTDPKIYVVQTAPAVIQRCMLMTSDPGDLVVDPTCGSGTTAFVAERWGRRWITVDTSRVPLALARQRVLTATFPWYKLQDDVRGPAGGFIYERRQDGRGHEVGGVLPRVTLGSLANDEPPAEEVLVDRPEVVKGVTRVSGPFVVEATIPTPVDWDADGVEDSGSREAEGHGAYAERMLEVLRRAPQLHLPGNRTIQFQSVRPPAKTLSLSAEAEVDRQPVAIVFGPEHGPVSEKLVFEAAREAHFKSYVHLYVIGFGIEPNARELVDRAGQLGVPATWVQATPDLMMGDLLKTMRSSQIFSVCGLPEIDVRAVKSRRGELPRWEVELLGLDVFDSATLEVEHRGGDDVPAWLLDTDYNDLCFRVSQAFFPRTGAWENLKRALRAEYEDSLWDHLAGTVSAPFAAPAGKREFKIAVKVIDERGNELMVVRSVRSRD